MAKKTIIKDKNVEELTKMLVEKRKELRKHRFEAAGARAKNPNDLAATRKEIARILTELGARAKVSK